MTDPIFKACPFCGEAPQVTKHFKLEAYGLTHRCKAVGQIVIDFADYDRIRRRWNTRAGSAGHE